MANILKSTLNVRQRQVIEFIAAGMTKHQAYRMVYKPPNSKDTSVACRASKLLAKPAAKAYLEKLLQARDAAAQERIKNAPITLDKWDRECARNAFKKGVKSSAIHARYLDMVGKRIGAFKQDITPTGTVIFSFDVAPLETQKSPVVPEAVVGNVDSD